MRGKIIVLILQMRNLRFRNLGNLPDIKYSIDIFKHSIILCIYLNIIEGLLTICHKQISYSLYLLHK